MVSSFRVNSPPWQCKGSLLMGEESYVEISRGGPTQRRQHWRPCSVAHGAVSSGGSGFSDLRETNRTLSWVFWFLWRWKSERTPCQTGPSQALQRTRKVDVVAIHGPNEARRSRAPAAGWRRPVAWIRPVAVAGGWWWRRARVYCERASRRLLELDGQLTAPNDRLCRPLSRQGFRAVFATPMRMARADKFLLAMQGFLLFSFFPDPHWRSYCCDLH